MSHPVSMPPMDEYNTKLIAAVHPADWTNPEPPAKPYDMVVIGAGTAGLITAIASAGLGKSVALVERNLMGGDCLNVGCVPSKALLRAAAAAAEIRGAAALGVHPGGEPDVRFDEVMARMRRLRASIAPNDSAARYTEAGVDVFLGAARFTGRDTLVVEEATLRFKRACIATGARAGVPPIPGLAEVAVLTNETLFELTALPKRLGIVGGGAIGCEMAQAFARLGSEVHLVEMGPRVLSVEEPDCAMTVQRALMRDGVRLLLGSTDLRLADAEGRIRMTGSATGNVTGNVTGSATGSGGAEPYDLVVDQVLVAAGRVPNTDGLGLEEAGVVFNRRGVQVDDHLRTTNPRIYAAGDIASKYQFTHAADAMARIVVRNALLGFLPFKPKASKLVMPWCTYTTPELAHVGAYPRELDEAGTAYQTVEVELADIDRAILESETEGKLKVHVTRGGRILGASLVSRHAGESISELTTAMVHGLSLQKLAAVIHPYPTQAEIIKRAADAWFKTWLLGWRDRITFWR